MARRPGRKGLPDELKVARGTDQPCRMGGDVSTLAAPDGDVFPPEGLPLAASLIWEDYAPGLIAMGTLKPVDAFTFGQWCQMAAAIQQSWGTAAEPPASYVAEWRKIGEGFGIGGGAVRKGMTAEGNAKPKNRFSSNGWRQRATTGG